ncbi:cell wall-binding protein [Desulfosporosinus orientis DSM 765]|uniref:Cell wall-binding protein n=2 Tax=Desulfosporosinus orientis TaxID=1563 RepID=G7W9S8_DESOD|nr:cell wall-binding protein [Desulfosporosinus orientis DSM 765]
MNKPKQRLMSIVFGLFSVLIFPYNALAASLPAPDDLSVTAESSSEIYLDWDSVSNATSYDVYRAASSSGSYEKIATTTASKYTDEDLEEDTKYYYKVRAVNGSTKSAYSEIEYARTEEGDSDSLSAPKNLSASAKSPSEIYVDWYAVNDSTSYYVYRSTSSSGSYEKIATTTLSRYTDTDLEPDTKYYYKVKAVKGSDTSAYSEIEYAKTENYEGSLSTPKELSATAESSSEIYLDWDVVSNATSYYVYRATSSSGSYDKIATTTSSKYTDEDLEEDTKYYYKVKAVNSYDSSDYSSIKYAKTKDADDTEEALPAPEGLSAEAESSDEIYLDWDSVDDAASYYVYRATSSSGSYDKIATTTSSKYTDTDLEPDTKYYYKVKAVNGSDKSAYSEIVHATTEESDDNDNLSAPEDLSATAKSSGEIYLDWDSVDDATSYYIYSSTSYSGSYNKIATTTSSSYTDTNLDEDTTYYYKVRAVNSTDTSGYSEIEYATTAESDDSDTLSAPTDLTASAESSSEIYLDWDSVSNANSYYVYRSTSSSGTYSKIATVTASSYMDTNLSANTTYYYKVLAVNNSGTSAYSSLTQGTTAKSDGTSSNPSVQVQTARLAGKDMYGTCAEVAKSGWNTSYYAVIVSGENFTDALCSAPLAQKYNAPLLLTSKDTLNQQTESELSRLKVKKVIMIGGSGVISSAVEQSIKDMGIGVSRIAGNDRYDTSMKIAQAMGQFDQAVVASGETFPDALSIAPIAAMKGIPILLTPKDTLPTDIEAYLLRTVQSTYVVGGTGVISDNVLQQLPSPKRLSGLTRYETNVSIIEEFAKDLDFGTCYLSTGENYADALSGSALAALSNSPVILVKSPLDQSTIDFLRSKMGSIEKEVVFGGTVVVPESILEAINKVPDKADIPSAPTEITATPLSSTEISLSWNSVSKATSYYIYGSTSSSGTYTQIATVTSTNYVNTGLWADTTYYYKVKAVNSSGESEYSPVDNAKTAVSDY